MKIAYIYYVHPTMTYEQVEATTQSIQASHIDGYDLYIHNTSDLDSSHLEILLRKYAYWNSVELLTTNNGSVAADIRYQLETIRDYNVYCCHKGDFYLGYQSIQRAVNIASANVPVWVGFSKFDLREDFNIGLLPGYCREKFSQIMKYPEAIDLTNDFPTENDIETRKLFGYRGLDGTMHVYNEEARANIHLNSYWNEFDVRYNHKEQEIAMLYGMDDIVGFHIFHELPKGRNEFKDVKGRRF